MTAQMRVLVGALAREAVAVPLEAAAAVIAMPTPARLPVAPAYLRGVIAWQGQLVPVIDAALLLGSGDDFQRQEAFILRRGERFAALLVGRVLGEDVLEGGVVHGGPADGDAALAFGVAVRVSTGSQVCLLDLEAIFDVVDLTTLLA